jgi:hypothetical protein
MVITFELRDPGTTPLFRDGFWKGAVSMPARCLVCERLIFQPPSRAMLVFQKD